MDIDYRHLVSTESTSGVTYLVLCNLRYKQYGEHNIGSVIM